MISDDLRVRIAFEWQPLPDWARWLMELGASVGRFTAKGSRLTVAVSVPTRAFSSLLISAGVVIGRCGVDALGRDSDFKSSPSIVDLALKKGTQVRWTREDSVKEGRFQGFEVRDGVTYANIWETDQRSVLVPLYDDADFGPVVRASNRARHTGVQPLDHALLGENARARRVEAVLVGVMRLLDQEAQLISMEMGRGADQYQGLISDILRPLRRGGSADLPFHTHLVSSMKRVSGRSAASDAQSVVIFDTSTAYLRLKDGFPGAAHVVILDRSSSQLDGSIEILNQAFVSRIGDWHPSFALPPPVGVQMMAFEVVP